MISYLGNSIIFISLILTISLYINLLKKIIPSTTLSLKLIYFINLIPFGLLVYAFSISDFTLLNVVENSYVDDPIFYKVTSAWGSHEGSILLWVFLINLFGVFFLYKNQTVEIHKNILFISTLFILYVIVSSNPFTYVEANENVLGLGLNPILQHFLFVIHPPTLFLGYIGLIIPFVISAHMLVNKNFSEKLFKEMLIWSKISWFFLTGGIVLGSYWAYSELGWGGWWFWDPVENISLIPWLLNTALIHSLQVSIKSNQLKLWSLNLGLYCFIASVFGTFLVRSNLIVSVHSFATDPLRGLFLIIIIAYLLAMTVRLNIKSISNFNEDSFNLISRESFLLLNNIFFICSALVVFIGTVYPLFSEMILKTSVSVGAPYYNFAFNLLLAPLILFMAFAPQINWGKHEKKDKQIPFIIIFSLLVCLVSYYFLNNFYFALSVFITVPLFLKSILVLKNNFKKNISFYSQWLAHLSIGFFIIAAVYTEQFDYEENLLFEKESTNEIKLQNNKTAIIKNIKDEKFQNYQRISVDLLISDGQKEKELSPSKNIYQPSGQVTNEVSTTNKLFSQYYATISTIESNKVGINLVYKPFINLLWLSAIMLVFSIFLSVVKKR